SASGTEAQLMGTKGPERREERSWMRRASTSLPVPLSPTSGTAMCLGATARRGRSSERTRSERMIGANTTSWRRVRVIRRPRGRALRFGAGGAPKPTIRGLSREDDYDILSKPAMAYRQLLGAIECHPEARSEWGAAPAGRE